MPISCPTLLMMLRLEVRVLASDHVGGVLGLKPGRGGIQGQHIGIRVVEGLLP